MKAASFFSSSLWKRRFSSSSTSPAFMSRTASSAMRADAVLGEGNRLAECLRQRLDQRTCSDISGTRLPSGRPKWLSTITLAPLADSSLIVGAARSMRVASVTLPFFIGTLRSTRTSTRLPDTSRSRSS